MTNKKLRDLRVDRGLTQVALAEACGLSRDTIRAIEKGTSKPNLATIQTLSGYFRVPVETLLEQNEEPNKFCINYRSKNCLRFLHGREDLCELCSDANFIYDLKCEGCQFLLINKKTGEAMCKNNLNKVIDANRLEPCLFRDWKEPKQPVFVQVGDDARVDDDEEEDDA